VVRIDPYFASDEERRLAEDEELREEAENDEMDEMDEEEVDVDVLGERLNSSKQPIQ